MGKLDGKVAIITGASRGIGQMIASLFAAEGAHVVCAARTLNEGDHMLEGSLARTVASIEADGGGATAFAANVAAEEDCRRLVDETVAQHGRLDILVNNAGIGLVGTIEQTSGADMDRLYSVNVKGVFNLSQAFVTGMIEQRRGTIINMASIGGVVGIRDRLAYCMTKFAVVGLTKAMALDHAAQGIRVNCICPCRVETPFVQSRLKEYPDPEQAYREMSATQPIGRMAQPHEIAAAALYLAADESTLITGTTLMTDGGWSAGK